ncbi:carbon-nitrogen hydrolase family protein [Botrimarina sp.]|uniref:carbon-nitrogen hydrolase family protein n=1 Tax=Botrimarina sp. TaxID=2795802 RepID=UPI0032F077C3
MSQLCFNRTSFAASLLAALTLVSVSGSPLYADDDTTQITDTARITLVQLTLRGQSPDTVIERMPAFFEQAAGYGSDLIVFPEYVLGYQIDADHPRVKRFRELAAQHGMYAIAGLVENHGDRYATTALVVDRGGAILGRYLKTHPASGPPPHFWPPVEGWDQEARGILGGGFKVFPLDFGTIGVLQCYDGYFPEAWGCTSFGGAEIVLWINGRDGMVEDSHCRFASEAYGCVVGANITDGKNTGFAGRYLSAEGEPEEARLFPRIAEPGDACVHATIDMAALRRHRKHLRTMHQRRPELYGLLTRDVRVWQDYPQVPWDHPDAPKFVNRSQLPPPETDPADEPLADANPPNAAALDR